MQKQKEINSLGELALFPELNPGPVCRLNKEGKILLANVAARNAIGEQNIIGDSWFRHCKNVEGETWQRILSSSKTVPVESNIRDEVFLFSYVFSKSLDLVFVFGTNITALKDAERKLSEIAHFPHMNPGPVLRMDLNGIVLLNNAAAQRLFGDIVGNCWTDMVPALRGDVWNKILSTEEVTAVEVRRNNCDYVFNHRRDFQTNLVFVFGTDITAQKEAEREVREIARFPDMNPGPVLRMNLIGTVLLNNAAAQKLFGHDIKGKSWLNVWPALQGEKWSQILSSENVIPVEVRLNGCDYVFNHRRDFHTDLVFVFGTDITAQKSAERKLAQSEKMAQLGTLAAGIAHELNNPAAAAASSSQYLKEIWGKTEVWRNKLFAFRLEEKDFELITRLTERARQSVTNPVRLGKLQLMDREAEIEDWLTQNEVEAAYEYAQWLVMMGFEMPELNDMLAESNPSSFFIILIWSSHIFQINSLLAELGEASSRISEIVKAMKGYSYLDQAPVQNINVHEGIENTLIIMRSKMKNGIEVKREYGNVPVITAYASELNQVWTNILDNAIDAMNGKGEIIIRTCVIDGDVSVELEDNGKGIPVEIQSKIFDPFFTTKPPGKGTGLGLSTVYGIITEKHHGKISVTSHPGKTIFSVRMPIQNPNLDMAG